MTVARVTLPDGKTLEVPLNSTCADVARKIGPRLAKDAVGCFWNGELTSMEQRIAGDGRLKIITKGSPEAILLVRHSAAHLLAAAVRELFPDAQLGFGPPTEEGFYYDFVVKDPFTPDDLGKIEKRMHEIAKEGLPFERKEMEPEAAAQELYRLGYKLKAEHLEKLKLRGEVISFYVNGKRFSDMCRGPHVASFGMVPAFKILSASGAYWLGDAKGIPMQRIHGTAFPSAKELEEHLARLDEAKKRDHRKLGLELDLFSFHEEAPGLPFWHHGGVTVWQEIERFLREELFRRGYKEIRTPLVLTDSLWHQSGHYDHYRDNMYFVEKEDRTFAVKPMNCPGACLLYKTGLRSYRDLPLRLAEFGLVHRYELSGVLHGLFRVRGFTQDDAHIYCTVEQIEQEVLDCLDMLKKVYGVLGFPKVRQYLSTRPQSRIGSDELWDKAEAALAGALKSAGIAVDIHHGDGAFYGPKIDNYLVDSIGREWQCGTIQLDFQMPERFGLEYTGADGQRHRPVMIHRAIVGSLERFIGVLVESCAGKLPVWLSPVQAILMPVTDKTLPYAQDVAKRMRAAGLRVDVDERNEKIGAKIRDAIGRKIPYLLVVGEREAAALTLSVRPRDGEDRGALAADAVIEDIRKRHASRAQDL